MMQIFRETQKFAVTDRPLAEILMVHFVNKFLFMFQKPESVLKYQKSVPLFFSYMYQFVQYERKVIILLETKKLVSRLYPFVIEPIRIKMNLFVLFVYKAAFTLTATA